MRELAQHFVLAADEVWRLQGGRDSAAWRERGGSDAECIAFQDMAALGHYGPGPGSKQGIYACTPSGGFLASVNSNDPEGRFYSGNGRAAADAADEVGNVSNDYTWWA